MHWGTRVLSTFLAPDLFKRVGQLTKGRIRYHIRSHNRSVSRSVQTDIFV